MLKDIFVVTNSYTRLFQKNKYLQVIILLFILLNGL